MPTLAVSQTVRPGTLAQLPLVMHSMRRLVRTAHGDFLPANSATLQEGLRGKRS